MPAEKTLPQQKQGGEGCLSMKKEVIQENMLTVYLLFLNSIFIHIFYYNNSSLISL